MADILVQVQLSGQLKYDDFVDVPEGVDPESFSQNLSDEILNKLFDNTNVDTGKLRESWNVEIADDSSILISNPVEYGIYVNDGNEPRDGYKSATIPVGFQFVEDSMADLDSMVSNAASHADEATSDTEESTNQFADTSQTYRDTGQTLQEILDQAGQDYSNSLTYFADIGDSTASAVQTILNITKRISR